MNTPDTWLRLITHSADTNNLTDQYYLSQMYWYDSVSAYTASCLGAFIGVFCFNKYLIINVFLGIISFSGLWALFTCFVKQYPNLIKPLSIAVFYIPSLVLWGSGLFKDTICLFGLGFITYTFFYFFERKKFSFILLILFIICVILLFMIKAYILVSFIPFIILKTFVVYRNNIQNNYKRFTSIIALIFLLGVSGIVVVQLRSYLLSFSVENVIKTVIIQKDYLYDQSLKSDGSAYTLGEFEPTPSGLFKKTLPAINVSLFRPYLWEADNAAMLFGALESSIFLVLTIVIILKKNILNTIKCIYKDPNLIMSLGFSLIFAFFVGISTFNFGSLSRYKIPCILFYAIFLVILHFNNEEKIELDKQTNES